MGQQSRHRDRNNQGRIFVLEQLLAAVMSCIVLS